MEKQIGARISQARKLKALTQEQFAEMCGISVSTLSRIETGSNTTSLKTLLNLCNNLDVGLEYVLFDFFSKKNLCLDPTTQDIVKILTDLDVSEKKYILDHIHLHVKHLKSL